MQFDEMGLSDGKVLFLLPGTACDCQTKVFDIVGLDCFLLTKTRFFQQYFPETEGCFGWQDFGYNRMRQVRQCVMILIGSAVMAWVFTRMG